MSIMTNNEICVIDDELYCLNFLFDFLEYHQICVKNFENCRDIIPFIEEYELDKINAFIIDLNIPVSDSVLQSSIKNHQENELYEKYPGLFLAQQLRNKGVQGKKIILYSVHQIEDIFTVARDRLGVSFISKGKPKKLKEEICKLCEIS
jgi:hypothetical protein